MGRKNGKRDDEGEGDWTRLDDNRGGTIFPDRMEWKKERRNGGEEGIV